MGSAAFADRSAVAQRVRQRACLSVSTVWLRMPPSQPCGDLRGPGKKPSTWTKPDDAVRATKKRTVLARKRTRGRSSPRRTRALERPRGGQEDGARDQKRTSPQSGTKTSEQSRRFLKSRGSHSEWWRRRKRYDKRKGREIETDKKRKGREMLFITYIETESLGVSK